MAKDTVIRCVQGGQIREFKVGALLGIYRDRLEREKGEIHVDDPQLEKKVTEDELKAFYAGFPYLNPNRDLPPMPNAAKVEFRKEEVEQPKVEAVEENLSKGQADVIKSMEVSELKEYLTTEGIEYNTRKKAKEYFVKLALTTIK